MAKQITMIKRIKKLKMKLMLTLVLPIVIILLTLKVTKTYVNIKLKSILNPPIPAKPKSIIKPANAVVSKPEFIKPQPVAVVKLTEDV